MCRAYRSWPFGISRPTDRRPLARPPARWRENGVRSFDALSVSSLVRSSSAMSMFRAYHQGNTAAATAAAAPAVDTGANRNMVSVPGDLSLVYPHAAAAAAWNFNVFHRGNHRPHPV